MDQSINQFLPQVVQGLLLSLSVELSSADISTLRLADGALSDLLRATVRTRLNKCAAVNSLPPEVLSAIFDLLRAGSSDCNDTYGYRPATVRPDNGSLIAMTHVCRRWRNVALDCARFWTNVSTSCALAPEFFERSRGMPLTVFASLIRGRPPPVPKQVFLEWHPRIRALHIDLECSMQIHHWRKHLRSLTKSLESLTIVNRDRRMRVRANPPLVMSLFGAESPTSLKSLSISSTTVLIPTDHFPTLEHAFLSMPDSSLYRLEPRMLLSNAPRLRTFCLHLRGYAAGHPHFHEIPDLLRIDLPMMRHLCISLPEIRPRYQPGDGHLGPVRTTLTNLNLPTTAMVSIQETSWTDKGSYMPDLYRVPSAGPAAESALSIDSRGTTFVAGGSPTISFQYPADITPKKIQSRYGMRDSARTKAALATVCALRIHSDPRWIRAYPRSFCLHTLATLTPRLTTLVLRDYTGEMAAHLARMLVPRGGAGPVPCPSLASVTYITLGRACTPLRAGRFALASPDDASTSTLDTILAATAVRARALQRRLPRLVFCCPSAPREHVLENNAHGVERVAVLRADVWAAPAPDSDSDGVRVFERWAEARCPPPPPPPATGAVRNPAAAGASTEEEEYGAAWAVERARVARAAEAAAEEPRIAETRARSQAGTGTAACGSGFEVEVEPGPASEPQSVEFGIEVEPEFGNGATVLTYLDLACCLLSMWFVQLLARHWQ